MSHVFCFVSTAKTENYSRLALYSFFKETKIEKGDIFVFVNNDGTKAFENEYPIDIYINNKTPKSFSENFNKGLRIAKKFKSHFVLLTNDVIFTKDWFEPLKQKNDAVLIPSCNINYLYNTPEFKTNTCMKIEEYLGKEQYLESFVTYHKTLHNFTSLQEKIFMQMYIARIPLQVYENVGHFDHSFSRAGGEDMDYRIRCALKGYKVLIANYSYLLHFHGKSTWDGVETSEQEKVRREQYLKRSTDKWGEDLTEIFIKGINAKEWSYKLGLKKEFDNNESYNIIRKLKNNYA